MADKNEPSELTPATEPADALGLSGGQGAIVADEPGVDEIEPVNLGARKYVHGAFFVLGVLAAFLSNKLLGTAWNYLSEWPAAVRAVPQIVNYSEDQRENITLVAGALVGILTILQVYRKETVRGFADEVARELGKVSWPSREAVVNGTLVVIIASAMATVYVAILDRFLGFLTTLVYGA